MALPLLAIGGQIALRAIPWVAGYLIVKETTDVFDPNPQGFTEQSGKTDFEKVIDGSLSVPSLVGRTNPIPSSPDNGWTEGFKLDAQTLIKAAALSGVAWVAFKALNEGKKLV